MCVTGTTRHTYLLKIERSGFSADGGKHLRRAVRCALLELDVRERSTWRIGFLAVTDLLKRMSPAERNPSGREAGASAAAISRLESGWSSLRRLPASTPRTGSIFRSSRPASRRKTGELDPV